MGLLLVQQQAVYPEVQSMRLGFKIEAAQLAAVCTTTQQTHTVIDWMNWKRRPLPLIVSRPKNLMLQTKISECCWELVETRLLLGKILAQPIKWEQDLTYT